MTTSIESFISRHDPPGMAVKIPNWLRDSIELAACGVKAKRAIIEVLWRINHFEGGYDHFSRRRYARNQIIIRPIELGSKLRFGIDRDTSGDHFASSIRYAVRKGIIKNEPLRGRINGQHQPLGNLITLVDPPAHEKPAFFDAGSDEDPSAASNNLIPWVDEQSGADTWTFPNNGFAFLPVNWRDSNEFCGWSYITQWIAIWGKLTIGNDGGYTTSVRTFLRDTGVSIEDLWSAVETLRDASMYRFSVRPADDQSEWWEIQSPDMLDPDYMLKYELIDHQIADPKKDST
ncbi:MAG: hypothetical protein AAF589_04720 [Planctomycetota bacterium]